jgi:hypothetical protein
MADHRPWDMELNGLFALPVLARHVDDGGQLPQLRRSQTLLAIE